MVVFILYRLSFSSGKNYIGQTVRSMTIRLNQHRTAAKRGSPLAVHCAWRKYGEPSVSIIGEYANQDELHAAEIAAIRDEGTLSPNGYNVGFGGETAPSKSPEVRAKIGAKSKGRVPNTPEERSAIARACWQSDEYRANQSDAQKAKWQNPEYRAMMSERRKASWAKRKAAGWVMPEETKAKMRGRPRTEKQIEAVREANKRRAGNVVVSEETRRKLAERAKEAWRNPEVTERRVAAIKAASARKAALSATLEE